MGNLFSNLNWADLGKGLLILIVSTILGALQPVLATGWPTWLQFEPILQTTIAAALLYIVKNIFTNPVMVLRSTFGTLNAGDIIWGIVLAVGAAFFSSLIDIFQHGWPTWTAIQPILLSAAMAGITYIIKNVFTNSEGTLAAKEPK